uniref:Peptidase M12B propeptide domain-containing protein n=1 Tax=Timema tahoe TaxID=61484 RepID=A0A7R9ITI6_9NEOP|nr:unnamed protein product [Timema tahoe]
MRAAYSEPGLERERERRRGSVPGRSRVLDESDKARRTGGDGHIHDLTIGYNVHGRDYVLDLRLNRDLIPKSYFERYQHNGQHVVNRPTGKDVELCQYQGRLRGLADSWAAISTCHGIR